MRELVLELMCNFLNYVQWPGYRVKRCPGLCFDQFSEKALSLISLVLAFFITLFPNESKSQTHYAELYLDCQSATCVLEEAAIRQALTNLQDQCQFTVNVLVVDQNVGLTAENGQITTPDGEVWMDASVDYLLLLEPASVSLFVQNSGELTMLEEGPLWETVQVAFNNLIPLPNKNYCATRALLSALPCSGGALSEIPCQVPEVEVAEDLTFLHLDVEELALVQETKRRLLSNHCAKVVIIKLPRLSPYYRQYLENHELPTPLIEQLHNSYGREVTLILVIPDPKSTDYTLGVQHIRSGPPQDGDCASQVNHILEWLPGLEAKRLPAAMAELETMLKGGEEYLDSQLADLQMTFHRSPEAHYGFDTMQYPQAHAENYETLEGQSNAPYYIPWQSIKIGGQEPVLTRRKDGGFVPPQVAFMDLLGAEVPIIGGNSQQKTLNVTAPPTTESLGPVYARMGGEDGPTVGQLNTVGYEEKLLHVVLVPVNGAQSSYSAIEIQNQLRSTYRQAVVEVSVTMHGGITVSGFDGQLNDEESGFLSNYTPQMRQIIRAYKQLQAPQPNVYYLFLVNDHEVGTKLGYMPRKKVYGLIINSHHFSLEGYAKTIAHELGHGAYVLQHIYKTYEGQLSPGVTKNLMDNGPGRDLHKYQWDLVHDPTNVWSVLDADEDRESSGVIARSFVFQENIYYEYEGSEEQYTCLTPSGELYAIPKDAIAAFYPRSGDWPAGCLAGFNWQGGTYLGWWRPNDAGQPFSGYAPRELIGNIEVPGTYMASMPVNPDSVYAAVVSLLDSCEVEIRRGYSNRPVYQLGENYPVDVNASVATLPVVFTTRYLTSTCLDGQQAWCLERYGDHPYFLPEDNSPIARVVKSNPCLIGDLIHYDFTPDNTESEWMEGLKNISAMGIGFGFLPVVLDAVIGHVIREFGRQKISQAMIGYSTDLLVQGGIKYYFPPEGTTVTLTEAFSGLDQFQATASAVEAMIELDNAWLNLGVSAASSCLVDGFTENGEIRDEFSMQACATGVTSAVLISGAISSYPHIRTKLRNMPKPQLVRGIISLLGDFDPTIHLNATIPLPEGIRYTIYKLFKQGDPLNAEDIEALFDITGPQAASIANQLNTDQAVSNALLDTDFWTLLRKQTANPNIRAELIADLANDVNLVEAFRQRPELVGAWEVALNNGLPESWRRNPDFLNPFLRVIDDLNFQTHIFDGQIVNGQTKGVHYFQNVNGSIIKTVGNASHTYGDGSIKRIQVAKKKTNGNYAGAKWSTFFPHTWSKDKILAEITFVRSKTSNKINDYKWKGLASDGVTEIEIQYTGPPGNIVLQSAFPTI